MPSKKKNVLIKIKKKKERSKKNNSEIICQKTYIFYINPGIIYIMHIVDCQKKSLKDSQDQTRSTRNKK